MGQTDKITTPMLTTAWLSLHALSLPYANVVQFLALGSSFLSRAPWRTPREIQTATAMKAENQKIWRGEVLAGACSGWGVGAGVYRIQDVHDCEDVRVCESYRSGPHRHHNEVYQRWGGQKTLSNGHCQPCCVSSL